MTEIITERAEIPHVESSEEGGEIPHVEARGQVDHVEATGQVDHVEATGEGSDSESDPDLFPREVVEELRRENGKHRTRGQALARRLHTELVRATGRLADPSDLPFDETHLDNPDALAAAVDELLAAKPHLATRRPSGDVGQGQRGPVSGNFSLLDMLRERT